VAIAPNTRRACGVAAALLIFVAIGQVWIITAGLKTWPHYSSNIARLTQAFLHGQTSLTIKPPRDLMALPNPYDPAKNFVKIYYDALLYHGKYYFYWGPAPSLIAAAFDLPLGVRDPDFGDEYLAFGFLLGTTCLATLLLFQIKARWFPAAGYFPIVAAIVSLGLGGPMFFALARPAMYEAMIAAGQFFLLAGFCAVFRGIEKKRSIWLCAAGICWAICIGSRVSLLPGIAAAIVVISRQTGTPKAIFPLALPPIVAVALLGWYNIDRFGNPFEFGLRWQLASHDQHLAAPGTFFSASHVLGNVFRYLWAEPNFERGFPFLRAGEQAAWPTSQIQISPTLYYDPLIGVLWCQPFLLLALASMRKDNSKWLLRALAAASVFAFMPDLLFQWSAMRYLLDAVPCISILAAVGCWNCPESTGRCGAIVKRIVPVLLTFQVVLALLLGIAGMDGNFKRNNPPLYNALRSGLSWDHGGSKP